jgi:hypothetical protein
VLDMSKQVNKRNCFRYTSQCKRTQLHLLCGYQITSDIFKHSKILEATFWWHHLCQINDLTKCIWFWTSIYNHWNIEKTRSKNTLYLYHFYMTDAMYSCILVIQPLIGTCLVLFFSKIAELNSPSNSAYTVLIL